MTVSKVCRFVGEYPSRGEASYGLQPVFVNLSEEQVRMGYEVHVIARRTPRQLSHEWANGVEIHRVSNPFNLTAFNLSRRLTKNEDGWVFHSHATAGIFLSLVGRYGRVPFVCHAHGTSKSHNVPIRYKSGRIVPNYSTLGITYDMLRERTLWSSADRLLVVSNAMMNDVTEFYGVRPEKVRVVYNGVDTARFTPGHDNEMPAQISGLEGKKLILYVGHFGLRKGVFVAIRAMNLIRTEVPDSHLVCVGGVPAWLGKTNAWELLRREVESNHVGDCVTLLDSVKNAELVGFYRRAEVCVVPSYYESFSKVAVEAMACGKPVVASRTGGLSEVVADGVTGRLVPFGSVSALAEALIGVLRNEKESRIMGSQGRIRAETLFTWRAVAERTKTAYDEIECN